MQMSHSLFLGNRDLAFTPGPWGSCADRWPLSRGSHGPCLLEMQEQTQDAPFCPVPLRDMPREWASGKKGCPRGARVKEEASAGADRDTLCLPTCNRKSHSQAMPWHPHPISCCRGMLLFQGSLPDLLMAEFSGSQGIRDLGRAPFLAAMVPRSPCDRQPISDGLLPQATISNCAP